MTKPLILSPAGDIKCLRAAINAGADEVYFGLPRFNARYNAKNFTDDELKEALRMCKILGVKSNITVNTLVTDREMTDVLDMVYNAALLGADAFIVQDLGLASMIKKEMPSVVLHASTQCACHNADGARTLQELGFDRVVLAREMPKDEIQRVIDAGIETEIFIHGALCVCQSGMCLMSSVIGDRSGNRGLCAQPCRLPYKTADNSNNYPLSLKDLSVADNLQELIKMGIASLKIEGRMKSPEYVYGTTKIWRELLDKGINADRRDMSNLEDIFSRGGFTSKYFTGEYLKDNRDMYGTRREGDKSATREAEKQLDTEENERKKNIEIFAFFAEGKKPQITANCDAVSVNITADFECAAAQNRPMTHEDIKSSLSKLGATYFAVNQEDVHVEMNGNIFLAKSQLNALRRDAVARLEQELCRINPVVRTKLQSQAERRKKKDSFEKLVVCKDISLAENIVADHVAFPLWQIENADTSRFSSFGVVLPRVVYSAELQECGRLLKAAKQKGAKFALVSNIGGVKAVQESGLMMFSDVGMNVFNSSSVNVLEEMGFSLITASPELNEAQIRDLSAKDETKICAFAMGRLPVMVLESCIVKAGGRCKNIDGKPCTILHDRIGKDFAVYGERRLGNNPRPCRNIIYNSVETKIIDSKEKMDKMNLDTAMIFVLE